MKLNPRKCKEIVIDPLEYNTTVLRPIIIENTIIEKFKQYKLFGVILTDDLKWKEHIAYIYGKACKRLYSLRVLRKAGVEVKNMSKVYLAIHKTSIRICCTREPLKSLNPEKRVMKNS